MQMARFSISFVVTIVMAVLALTGSAYESYGHQQPANTYKPPTESALSPSPSNPTCRKFTELCEPYGDYSCCEGFYCIAWIDKLPGGVGVCTPSNQPPQLPTEKCQKSHQLCQPYPPYDCCKGLQCVHPRTLQPIAGINPEDLKLPPGVGICEVIKL